MSWELNILSAVDSYLSPLKIEIVVFYWSIQGRKKSASAGGRVLRLQYS